MHLLKYKQTQDVSLTLVNYLIERKHLFKWRSQNTWAVICYLWITWSLQRGKIEEIIGVISLNWKTELQGIKALDKENPQVAHCIHTGKADMQELW